MCRLSLLLSGNLKNNIVLTPFSSSAILLLELLQYKPYLLNNELFKFTLKYIKPENWSQKSLRPFLPTALQYCRSQADVIIYSSGDY